MFKIFCVIAAVLLMVPMTHANDHFVIVVESNVSQDSISQSELRSLFTLKKRVWSNGAGVQVFTLTNPQQDHKNFVKNRLKLFPYQIRRLWNRQVFSSSARQPIQTSSYAEMLEQIAMTEGGIGYLPQANIELINNDKVKILTVN